MPEILLKGDAYCCPVCYIEAHRRNGISYDDIDGDKDSISSDTSEGVHPPAIHDILHQDDMAEELQFKFSPMDVLAGIGLEEASTICFDKLAHVKEHIRGVHGFNPSVMEGNDLFHRFRVSCPYYSLVHSLTFKTVPFLCIPKIRAGDGLRQQYGLSSWTDKEKLMFNKLKLYMSHRPHGETPTLFNVSNIRAQQTWDTITMPYLWETNDVVDDTMITTKFEPIPMMDAMEEHPEESIVKFCHQMNAKFPNCKQEGSYDEPSFTSSDEGLSSSEVHESEEDDEGEDIGYEYEEYDSDDESDEEEDDDDNEEDEEDVSKTKTPKDNNSEQKDYDWSTEKDMKSAKERWRNQIYLSRGSDSDNSARSTDNGTRTNKRRRIIDSEEEI